MNLEAINEMTPHMVDRGVRVLQAHRFAPSDFAHVSRLERWAELPLGARVADMGSGIGETARIFSDLRSDLSFCLVNISQAQMDYASPVHQQILCNFLSVPEPDAAFDAAIFLFSLGHEDRQDALTEAARLLKPGGILFIYDMVRVSGDNVYMRDSVEYEVEPRQVTEIAAAACGFYLDYYMEPQDDGRYGRDALGDDFVTVFAGTIPAVWRFVRM